jgi:hypothetical protein
MGRIQPHMDLKYIFYHGALSRAIDSVVETIGVPPKSMPTPTSPSAETPRSRRMVHHQRRLAASPLNMFIPLADRAGMNQFYVIRDRPLRHQRRCTHPLDEA